MTQKISPEVFASAVRIASAMRSLSPCEIISTPHQLPDEPPPPNEPPPPENPPPPEKPSPEKPPPEKPPEEPDHQDDPEGQPLPDLPRRRLFGWLGIAPTIMMKTSQNTPSAKIRTSILPQGGVGSGRFAARCFHSSASPVRTLMMSSAPRVTPPGTSLARKRGMIAFSMMSLETASVSVPSRP